MRCFLKFIFLTSRYWRIHTRRRRDGTKSLLLPPLSRSWKYISDASTVCLVANSKRKVWGKWKTFLSLVVWSMRKIAIWKSILETLKRKDYPFSSQESKYFLPTYQQKIWGGWWNFPSITILTIWWQKIIVNYMSIAFRLRFGYRNRRL